MELFPIIGLGEEGNTKFIPRRVFDMKAEIQAVKNHGGQSLDELAARGGISASEALAIIEHRPHSTTPVTETAARLAIKAHVDRYEARAFGAPLPRSRHQAPPAMDIYDHASGEITHVELKPASPGVATSTLADLDRGVALAKMMQRHVNVGTHLHAQYGELIRTLENARVLVRAMAAREGGR